MAFEAWVGPLWCLWNTEQKRKMGVKTRHLGVGFGGGYVHAKAWIWSAPRCNIRYEGWAVVFKHRERNLETLLHIDTVEVGRARY